MEDYAALVIAVWGAVLSTCLAIFEVYRFLVEQRTRKPRIIVEMTLGFMRRGEDTRMLIYLSAANAGDKVVTLSFPALLLPDRRYLTTFPRGDESDVAFPHELLPGRSCQTWREIRKLAQSLLDNGYSGTIEIVGEFRDVVGNRYKSKPFTFNIAHWSKS